MTSWIVLVVVGGAAVVAVILYNRLVTLRERFRNAFAQIDVQLKRRYDLIPNLVETVRAYMSHERETLEAVIQARDRARQAERQAASDPGEPAAMSELSDAERRLGGALSSLFAVAEDYPDLRASENVQQLQEELTSTENRIAFARQAYNDAVMRYNATRASVPTNLIAGAFGFVVAAFFRLDEDSERQVPRTSFG